MLVGLNDLQVRYSGGSSNTAQGLSLGGALSTVAGGVVKSQDVTGLSSVTGVVLEDAFGNGLGTGYLRWDSATSKLGWRQPGQSDYDEVVVSGSGSYLVGSETDGFLCLTVTTGLLPVTTQTDTVVVANLTNLTYDNITSDEAYSGNTDYRCFYVYNRHPTSTIYDVRIWIQSNTSGPDDLMIALDSHAKNTNAIGPLVDEADSTGLLSGLTFSQPATHAEGLQLGDLAPGEYRGFWMKRIIGSGITSPTVSDVSSIGISGLM